MKQPKHKTFITTLVALLLALQIQAQPVLYRSEHVGFNVAANLAFGTHFRRLGVNLNFFYVRGRFQANSEARVYFNFKSPGPGKAHPELVLSQGVLVGYGDVADYYFYNPFLGPVANQTGRRYMVAYSYNAYFNTVRTTQQTGIVALQFDPVTFIMENDLLARPSLDRFRTGAFLLQYQYDNIFQAAINCSMWTGQMGNRTNLSDSPIRSGCYMDTTGGVYPTLSHGLLSAQFKYNTGYYCQNLQANVGVDAEQVRNAVQNKFIHDMRFLPQAWRTKNCHIPMVDDKGEQYLYKEGQRIRKPKLFLNVFSNPSTFY